MKRIVTIGGGSGQPQLLAGLREHDVDLTAIVTMMDNGGSSGVLREERGVLPPGDIRKCIVALAQDSDQLAKEWNVRDKEGHAAGNFTILQALKEHGSWQKAIDALSAEHNVRGRVLPVTTESTHLLATLENGEQVRGEEAIDVPAHDANLHIATLELDPPVETTQEVREAIAEADCIVLTMGDLYTSVIPNLLTGGVTQALAQTDAPIVYVCNRTSKPGETHGFTTASYARVLSDYLAPAELSHMVIDDETVAHPSKELHVAPEMVDGVEVIATDLTNPEVPLYIDGKKAAQAIINLCT
jgi:uncharacterized cofD-like protein